MSCTSTLFGEAAMNATASATSAASRQGAESNTAAAAAGSPPGTSPRANSVRTNRGLTEQTRTRPGAVSRALNGSEMLKNFGHVLNMSMHKCIIGETAEVGRVGGESWRKLLLLHHPPYLPWLVP